MGLNLFLRAIRSALVALGGDVRANFGVSSHSVAYKASITKSVIIPINYVV